MTKTMKLFIQMRDMGLAVTCSELDTQWEKELNDAQVLARKQALPPVNARPLPTIKPYVLEKLDCVKRFQQHLILSLKFAPCSRRKRND